MKALFGTVGLLRRMSEFVLEMETFTTVSCNEITMNLRTTIDVAIDVGVLAEAGQVYFDLSVASIPLFFFHFNFRRSSES